MCALGDLVARVWFATSAVPTGRLAHHAGARRGERRGSARFESVQSYYSLAGRDIEREIVPMAEDQKLAILAWSLWPMGSCRGSSGPMGGAARRAAHAVRFPPVNRERVWPIVDAMRAIGEPKGASPARVASPGC